MLDQFWRPLLQAMPDLHRRSYIFLAGEFKDEQWVAGAGDFIGTFVNDWLGIPASGQSIHLRFGEICRLNQGIIVQVYTIFDLADLIRQVGLQIFPPDRGRVLWIPGPRTGNGLLLDSQTEAESRKTLALVEAMIFGGLLKYDGQDQKSMGLQRYWHPEMVWYGPAGIGTAVGIESFKKNAQKSILRAFPDRTGGNHQARLAEGHYAISTGWPSLEGTHLNAYLGAPATDKRIGMRIIDVWRREKNLLKENWVLIDLLDLFMQFDIDLLDGLDSRAQLKP